MQIIETDYPDFKFHEDRYPFTESKQIIESIQDWFTDATRANDQNC